MVYGDRENGKFGRVCAKTASDRQHKQQSTRRCWGLEQESFFRFSTKQDLLSSAVLIHLYLLKLIQLEFRYGMIGGNLFAKRCQSSHVQQQASSQHTAILYGRKKNGYIDTGNRLATRVASSWGSKFLGSNVRGQDIGWYKRNVCHNQIMSPIAIQPHKTSLIQVLQTGKATTCSLLDEFVLSSISFDWLVWSEA